MLVAGRRAALLLAGVVVLAAVHLTWRPPTVCLLRAAVGVPCPLCGGTTAGVRLGRGDLTGAVAASPLAVLLAAAFVVRPLVRVPELSARAVWLGIGGLALAAEVWQLSRFGLL